MIFFTEIGEDNVQKILYRQPCWKRITLVFHKKEVKQNLQEQSKSNWGKATSFCKMGAPELKRASMQMPR